MMAILVIGACLKSSAVPCGDRVCPPETTCDLQRRACLTDEQAHACDDKTTGETCGFSNQSGRCFEGLCLLDDDDGDGITGVNDNCPLAINPDQADGDDDGFGDTCDHCPALPTARNHDEDDDGYGDECDKCPAIADFQDDADGDGVSIACGSVAAQTWKLLAFEPFVDQGTWEASPGVIWQSDGDSIAPLVPLAPTDPGLVNRSFQLASAEKLFVDIGFASDRPWAAGDRFGVSLLREDGTRIVSLEVICVQVAALTCRYNATFSNGTLMNNSSTSSLPLSRLRIELNQPSGSILVRMDGSNSFPTIAGPIETLTSIPAVSASPTIRLRHFAVWSVVQN